MSTPPQRDAEASDSSLDDALSWGVGSVAARLGISASTLRTWERRYGVGPTRRTAGGHRRYTESDIDRVTLTQRLIDRGAPPRDAARVAHSLDDAGLASALAGDPADDSSTWAPAEEVIDGIVSAAREADAAGLGTFVADALRQRGVVEAWTTVIAPTLIRIGDEWNAGRMGVEAERLASEIVIGELRARTRSHADLDRSRPPVIIASAEDDQHSIPVFALESALAEVGLGAHVLGSTFPASALASLAAQVRPAAVFLWASLERSAEDPVWDVLAALPSSTRVILGGPGWPYDPALRHRANDAVLPADLQSTVDRIADAMGAGAATSGR